MGGKEETKIDGTERRFSAGWSDGGRRRVVSRWDQSPGVVGDSPPYIGVKKSVAKSRLSETTPTILFKRTQVKIWVNVKLPGGEIGK